MGKAAKKLNPTKINHPNSRKAQQYVKFKNKETRREKKKLTHFVKLNSQGEKVLWFRDNLDQEAEEYTRSMVDELIEKYLGRFDEEMSIIQSVKPYEKQKYASRRDQLRHTMEDERNEYNGCGFEIPDILNKTHLDALRKWNGELSVSLLESERMFLANPINVGLQSHRVWHKKVALQGNPDCIEKSQEVKFI